VGNLTKAKRPGESPSRPFLPEESDLYFLLEVFRFAFRAAGLFFAVFLFFFGAISASSGVSIRHSGRVSRWMVVT
jgi:hypothetical protein